MRRASAHAAKRRGPARRQAVFEPGTDLHQGTLQEVASLAEIAEIRRCYCCGQGGSEASRWQPGTPEAGEGYW